MQTVRWEPELLFKTGRELEAEGPQAVLGWAVEAFGPRLTVATSFGLEDVAIVDMVWRIDPKVDFFYLDTGLLFPETYQTRDRLAARYGIRFRQVRPELTVEEQADRFGEALWSRDADRCCELRKVQPLRRALEGRQAWVTGIRRGQAITRRNTEALEWDARFGLVKVNPLVAWTENDVWRYVHAHDVPNNPLHDRGFPSIGCWPCTRAVAPGEDARAGRWSGLAKTECGIHAPTGQADARAGPTQGEPSSPGVPQPC